ncbi:MAG: hypothetical protein VX563_04495, partial [Planctomycetota bacterium]|nr:hypothetical protein [Planctomycetota bacterium]
MRPRAGGFPGRRRRHGGAGWICDTAVGTLLVAVVAGTAVVSLLVVVAAEMELWGHRSPREWLDVWTSLRGRPTGRRRKLVPSRDPYADPPLYEAPGVVDGVRAAAGPGGDYPTTVPLTDILRNWPYLDTVPAERIYDTLRHFDWTSASERATAESYRALQVPFVADGVDAVARASRRWSWRFLESRLARANHTLFSEWSDDPLLMYWKLTDDMFAPEGYERPTRMSYRTSFGEWFDSLRAGSSSGPPSGRVEGPAARREAHSSLHVDYAPGAGGTRGPGAAPEPSLTTGFVMEDLGEIFFGRESAFFRPDRVTRDGGPRIYCRFTTAGSVVGIHYDNHNNAISM